MGKNKIYPVLGGIALAVVIICSLVLKKFLFSKDVSDVSLIGESIENTVVDAGISEIGQTDSNAEKSEDSQSEDVMDNNASSDTDNSADASADVLGAARSIFVSRNTDDEELALNEEDTVSDSSDTATTSEAATSETSASSATDSSTSESSDTENEQNIVPVVSDDEYRWGNLDFTEGLDYWTTTGSVEALDDTHGEGEGSILLNGKNASVSQTVTGLSQGSYTVKAWIKGTSSSNYASMTVSDTGGPSSVVKTDAAISDSEWKQIAHRNVLVYNGQMTVTFSTGASGAQMYVDDIEIVLDSEDENTIENWNFENGLKNWNTCGTVKLDNDNYDTGNYAARLSDQSEISQVISVEPDTDYIATVRLKVEEEDTYSQTIQNSYDGSSKVGVYVERLSLGDRVNLGVRGLDGTVLRQAPASTTGYSLVTIAFHTRASDSQVEIYANTIYDENYLDSVTVYENTEGSFDNGYQRPNPDETDNTHPSDTWTTNGSHYAWADNFDVFKINNDYIKGADVSFMQAIEDCGGKYFANGVQQDMLRILSNHGVNSVLSMAMVHAGNEVYTWTDLTKLSTSSVGYDGQEITGRQMIEGYFDKEHCIALALRAKELGMTYAQSFHYSDTWISAAKAHMPLDFILESYDGTLSNPDIYMLETAVYNYVYDFLSDMKDKGADNLIMVKDGNEQDGGLVFPVAMGSNYAQHAAIITASSTAASRVYPGIINTIHTNTGYSTAQFSNFFGKLKGYGAEFTGMAFSFYGGRAVKGTINMMETARDNDTFKWYDYINVETGMSFTKSTVISDTESAMGVTSLYDISATGQYNWLLDYIQAPLDVPNETGVMRGFYYWNTEAIPIYGAGHKEGEAAGGTKRTLFNNGTTSLIAMGSSQEGKAGDMVLGVYAYLHRGYAKAVEGDVYTSTSTGVSYETSDAESISFENDGTVIAVGEETRINLTISPADTLLNDYKVSFVSSDSSVVSVSEFGIVTGISEGSAVITATVGSVSGSMVVNVSDKKAVTDLSLNYEVVRNGSIVSEGTITNGEEILATALDYIKIYPNLNEDATDRQISFEISDTGACEFYGETWQTDGNVMRTINEGLSTSEFVPLLQINALSDGTEKIKAYADEGDVEFTFDISVSSTPVENVIVSGSDTIAVGGTSLYTAAVYPEDATFNKIVWSSSDENVVSIDENGLAEGLSLGKAVIRAASAYDETIYGELEVEVVAIRAEKIVLSRKAFGILIGDTKTVTATVLPKNTADTSIIWSQSEGSEEFFTVDDEGNVTAISEGEGDVIATCGDGSGVYAVCRIYVQNTKVEVEDMELSDESYYFVSSYFSSDEDNRHTQEPTYQVGVSFTPENATYVDVQWTSDNEAVAQVDENGVVTAIKGGVASTCAYVEGADITRYVSIYVPEVSEDFENYETGESGGFTDSNTFTYSVEEDDSGNKVLQAAVESKTGGWKTGSESISRHSFDEVSGDVVVVDFDWDTGYFSADNKYRGANVSVEDADGNTYLALSAYPDKSGTSYAMTYYCKNGSTAMPTHNGDVNGDFNYVHGGAVGTYTDCIKLSDSLKGENLLCHVHIELDYEKRTISFTVTDLEDGDNSASVDDIAMDDNVAYTDSVGAIAFSQLFNSSASWHTTIDNFAVYNAGVMAEDIEYDVECINFNDVTGIKIVPVKEALSSTAKINASVIPSSALQSITYQVSSELEGVIEVDDDGNISVNEDYLVAYDQQDSIVEKSGYITFYASTDQSVSKTVALSVGKPNASETIQVYADGEEYLGEISLSENTSVKLSYAATGGDGISDVYSYSFEVSDGDAQIDGDVLTVGSSGKVTVTFTLDLFRGEEVFTMIFYVGDYEETESASESSTGELTDESGASDSAGAAASSVEDTDESESGTTALSEEEQTITDLADESSSENSSDGTDTDAESSAAGE